MNTRLAYQFHLLQSIRNFFLKKDFLDVLTPPMVPNPGFEAHIHPFSVVPARDRNKDLGMYLHTSPEFAMKHLLSEGFERIFNLSYCFRDDIDSPIHRNQFIMLEWYRANARYEQIMDDTEDLVLFCRDYLERVGAPMRKFEGDFKCERYTIQEIFQEYLNFDILEFLDKKELKDKILKDFKDVPVPQSDRNMLWEDYFFLLFLNKIENSFHKRNFLMLYEFPRDLSALSTLKEKDPRVCERFEIYIQGVELCNCFNELRDLKVQKNRFEEQRKIKKQLYAYELPEPQVLFNALKEGFPPSAGNALGVERLLLSLVNMKNPFFE